MAQRDNVLKQALNSSDFPVPDGIGLNYASRFLYGKSLNIIHGRKLFESLMQLANKMEWKVFFLGGENGEAAISARKISLNYKNIKIKAQEGPMFNGDGEPATESGRKLYLEVAKEINSFGPEILIICLSDPKEEKWVYKNYNKLNIGGAAAFGGTFRYVAGMSKLPPAWMEKAGLEWIYRLITEPYRWRRILNAFPIFPLRVFWFKVTGR